MTNPWETLPNQRERPRASGCVVHALLVAAALAFGCGGGFIATPFVVEKLWGWGVYDWPLTMPKVAAVLALVALVLPFERTGRALPAMLALAAGAMVGNCMGFMSMQ
ncbi:hypothetical protein LBMAG42_33110 [Deltaproteobacteria bacterium]|nr:hypothetical protein LBMAG42_33110 [Deltaproteobacteria bacterium]